jgi:alkylhydroperoxidase/carboxymuconolactone decarboxylase family protein YurZ
MEQQTSESPVLELLAKMTTDSIEASSLDPKTLMLVRIAGLVAVDAPPASYLLNIGIAGEADVDSDEVQGVLVALAPIVGTARIASAATKLVRALDLAINIAELEEAEATQGA